MRTDTARRPRRLVSPEEEGASRVCSSAGLRDTPGVRHLQGRSPASNNISPPLRSVRRGKHSLRVVHRVRPQRARRTQHVLGMHVCTNSLSLFVDLLERCSEEEEEEEVVACSEGESCRLPVKACIPLSLVAVCTHTFRIKTAALLKLVSHTHTHTHHTRTRTHI